MKVDKIIASQMHYQASANFNKPNSTVFWLLASIYFVTKY